MGWGMFGSVSRFLLFINAMPTSYRTPPASSEYASFYAGYVGHVPPCDIMTAFASQGDETLGLLRGLSEKASTYRYEPDKWSIKQVVGHMIEAERVFVYRALSFSRNETQPLPGYEQNDYVAAANFDEQPWDDLLEEMGAVRKATIYFFRGLSDEMMERTGIASGVSFTVRALAYIIVGHERHHLRILQERYAMT